MGDGTEIGIWFPAYGAAKPQRLGLYAQQAITGAAPAGRRLPLIVMSHGNGGHFAGHSDTAAALARAGFVVASLTHPGDNWRDQSRATQMNGRVTALTALITHMLESWQHHAVLDPQRVGAFGFSAGGFTVLAAAGGRPDLARMGRHCADHPGFFDCGVVKAHPLPDPAWTARPDRRIKAVVAAAPALGFTFGRTGLSRVTMPVQLWRADNDPVLPAPFYADAVRADLPRRPEFHAVPGAGHFDFLAPCDAGGALARICATEGFDRGAFHARFNAEVVRFFRRHLARAQRPG
ncbi:prolyl oligopeptidase family serine peptidase [Sphingomonas changnyeongensis]|uniref:Prolyl oligopeptidase family serine peptidase n=2 Tax=Sphingomonas changnyeongensis TaxID=2698679 RepID=A0A7Z2S8U9_9SPHN|nr:prolyl oligopeptidase family serine peptidase [Sphingomonas changnyeongensis]